MTDQLEKARRKYRREGNAYLRAQGLKGNFVAESMIGAMVNFRVRSEELAGKEDISTAEAKELSEAQGKLVDNARRILSMMEQQSGFGTIEEARAHVTDLFAKWGPDLLVFEIELEELPTLTDADENTWAAVERLEDGASPDGEGGSDSDDPAAPAEEVPG